MCPNPTLRRHRLLYRFEWQLKHSRLNFHPNSDVISPCQHLLRRPDSLTSCSSIHHRITLLLEILRHHSIRLGNDGGDGIALLGSDKHHWVSVNDNHSLPTMPSSADLMWLLNPLVMQTRCDHKLGNSEVNYVHQVHLVVFYRRYINPAGWRENIMAMQTPTQLKNQWRL